MRYWVVAAVALVVGLVIGGIAPRAELRRVQAELEEARSKQGRGVGSDLARMFGRGGLRAAARGEEAPIVVDPGTAAPPARDDDAADAPPPPGERRRARLEARREGEDGEPQDLGAVREALELRRTQARAALVEDAGADDAQLAEIDAAVAAMNKDLLALGNEFVERYGDGSEPTRHDAMSFAADALDVMLEADEAISGALDPEQLEAVEDEAVDPFSYIDPALIDLLEQVDRP